MIIYKVLINRLIIFIKKFLLKSFIKVYWIFFIKIFFIILFFLEFFFISFFSLNKKVKLVLKFSLSAKKDKKGSESCIHKTCSVTLFFSKRSQKNERTVAMRLKKNENIKKGSREMFYANNSVLFFWVFWNHELVLFV